MARRIFGTIRHSEGNINCVVVFERYTGGESFRAHLRRKPISLVTVSNTKVCPKSYGTALVGIRWKLAIKPCDLVMCPLNFSEGHYNSTVACKTGFPASAALKIFRRPADKLPSQRLTKSSQAPDSGAGDAKAVTQKARWELPGHDWRGVSASHQNEARHNSLHLHFMADTCPALLLT
jgi:hypothetical protein